MHPVVCTRCQTRFALGLLQCPRCKQVSPQYAANVKEEEQVPRITVAGGPSNADAVPGEVGYAGPEPVELPDDGPVAAAPADTGWQSMTLAQLREAAKARGLSGSGAKADVVARLAEHDNSQAAATSEAELAPVEPEPAADDADITEETQ